MSDRDTIYALSSGALPSGVAVVRVSGPGTRFALETIAGAVPPERRAALRRLRDAVGGTIDHGLVLWLPGPDSFTGEDMAELQVHGGRAVVAAILARLGGLAGLRAAEPGEFARRAFLNGRIDLTAAEGLADLIAAETEAQRRQALRQAGGAFARLAEDWRARILDARALVEAELDFPDEDDVPGAASEAAWSAVATVAAEIRARLADRRGERLRHGLEVMLMGPPNAGKSSLLNALARREAAIVAPEPGTTRDLIEVALDIGGYPVLLVDSAGLRDAEGTIEREGIRRAAERARTADLVLWLVPADAVREAAMPDFGADVAVVRVGTKADLGPGPGDDDAPRVSAVDGTGLDALAARVAAVAADRLGTGEDALVTNARQRDALAECAAALERALDGAALPLELRAEDLRAACDALGRITGRVGVEDVLDRVFGAFCIGK